MKFIKRLLLKFLKDSIYQIDKIDIERLRDWLFYCHTSSGFKHYYTMRKKYLISLLTLDPSNKERHKIIGRLEELKALGSNVNTEFKKRAKEEEKKKKELELKRKLDTELA